MPPPKQPIRIEIIITLYPGRLSQISNANCRNFCSFSACFASTLFALGQTMSIRNILFLFVYLMVTSGCLVVVLRMWNWKSHFNSAFSMTVPFFYLSVFFPSSSSCIPNATHSIISAFLCIIRYSAVASLAHPKNQYLTVSFVCLHILHLSRFRGKPMFAFDALVSTICSCTAIIDVNFFGSILPCSHIWLFSSVLPYTSLYMFRVCTSLIYSFLTSLFERCSVFRITFLSLFYCWFSSHTPSSLNFALTFISFSASFFCSLFDWLPLKAKFSFPFFFYPHTTWKRHIVCHSYLYFCIHIF